MNNYDKTSINNSQTIPQNKIFNNINNISNPIQINNSTDNIINNKRIIKPTGRLSKKVFNNNIKIDNNNENKNGKTEDHNNSQQRKRIKNKINDNDSSNKINNMKTVNNVNNMDKMKNKNLTEKEKKQKPTIQMMRNREQYNICEDLLNIPANITIGQLLNISKISKDELIKGIKNSKQNNENIINATNSNIDNNYNNNDNSSNNENYSDINYNSKIANNLNNNNNIVHEHDVAVVRGYINGYPASIFIDACSNANLISRKFLNKFVKNYQIIGHDKSTIRQAMVDDISRVYDIVRLAVKLGSVEFITDFKISDKDDPFYDAIISLKTQSDNRILIDTIHKVLAYMNMDDKLVPISNIEDINNFRSQSLLSVSPEPKIDIVEATLFVNTNESNSNISTKEKDNEINSIIDQIKFKIKKIIKNFVNY